MGDPFGAVVGEHPRGSIAPCLEPGNDPRHANNNLGATQNGFAGFGDFDGPYLRTEPGHKVPAAAQMQAVLTLNQLAFYHAPASWFPLAMAAVA